jgi:uncharacterized repeat protein (TIGR03847 family)
MPGETHDFDVVKRLEPDAVGVPGARRFRLIVQNNDDTAFLWLEKEQLQALGLAVDQLLTPIKAVWTSGEREEIAAAPTRARFEGAAEVEVRVGRMGLGYDEESQLFVIVAHDAESDADEPPAFKCRCSRTLLSGLSNAITEVTSAGRARCPLCGTPLDSPVHFCPGSNGHSSHE